ncbi:hypothetical protein [Jiangella anatolica]|uniref:Uncharacterized protein n=1 Tax=Jiangella anatolica TaxID=2670374 RepID=A0A2W2BSL9_9ACTN|nr:hypothetical protein [Jiangella anatolica]PZF79179.1 hypothetical protein C1I92_32480 [Jiangella anatolica]
MPDTPRQRQRSALAIVAAVVVVALAVVAAVWLSRDSGGDEGSVAAASASSFAPGGQDVLPRAMGGQEAIDALGERLGDVAELNGMTADQLRDLLLRDASVEVAPSGRLLYDDDLRPPPTPR